MPHSRTPRLQPRTNDFANRMVLGIANDFDPAAAFAHNVALGNCGRSVVGALGVNVRPNFADQSSHIPFGKNDHRVHIGECGQNFRTLWGRDQGAAFTLERRHRFVGIDGYDQASAQLFRGMQIAYVTDVKQIESAIGQCDGFAGAAPFRNLLLQFFAAKDFVPNRFSRIRFFLSLMRPGHRRGLGDRMQQFPLGYGCGATLHDHDPAGIIGQVGRFFGASSSR